MANERTSEYINIDFPYAGGLVTNILPGRFALGVSKPFSKAMGIPIGNNGQRMTLQHFNGLAYAATIGAVLDGAGYPYGHNKELNQSLFPSGFPEGAIVTLVSNGTVREFISLVANNTDTSPWDTFPENEEPVGEWEDNDNWRWINPPNPQIIKPDYSAKEILVTEEVGENKAKTITLTTENRVWLQVEREIENWEAVLEKDVFAIANNIEISPIGEYISLYEGKIATRVFPFPQGELVISANNKLGVPTGNIRISVSQFGEEQ